MSTDDGVPGNPFSPHKPRDGEQPPDLLPGEPEARELELDSYGVPVQDRSAKGSAYLLAAGSLICGAFSAWLAIMNDRARLPGYLVDLGMVLAFLSLVPVWVLYRGPSSRGRNKGW